MTSSLVVLQTEKLTGLQTALVVTGAILAVVAALITNVVLAIRNRRRATIVEEIESLHQRIQGLQNGLAVSLTQGYFARVMWGLVETADAVNPEIYTNYFHTSVNYYTQAGLTAAGLLTGSTLGEEPPTSPRLKAIIEAKTKAQAEGPSAFQALADEVDKSRLELLSEHNKCASTLKEEVAHLGRYEQTSMLMLTVGTSVQILSLVAVTAKDLV
jgi:hypothetical protein